MKTLSNRTLYEIEKERKIKESISTNSYVPRKEKIKFELNESLNSSDLNKSNKFFYGNSVREDFQKNDFFSAKEISSISKFKNITSTIKNDLKYIYSKYSEIDDALENTFRSFLNKSSKFIDEYKKLELEINRELISKTNSDMFTFGITEYFDNEEKVIKDETTAFIVDGKVICKPKKMIIEEPKNYILSSSSRMRNFGAILSSDINSINHILKKDGSYYQHVAYSKSQYEIVDFILDVNLNNNIGIDIKVIRLDLLNPGSKTMISVYTANQLDNWEPSFEGLSYVTNGTNLFTINKEKVKFIKVVITKDEADTYINDNYIYNFVIDYIGLIDMQYETVSDSVLVCGPYEIKDPSNIPVNFTYATIKSGTCCTIPDQTSIEFYLSKDKLNWKHLSFWDQTNSVASFGESVSDLFSLVDSTSNLFLITSASKLQEYNLSVTNNEAILNFYIPAENMNFYKPGSAIIKRATRNSVKGGWFYKGNSGVTCNFFINNFDGIYLDFKSEEVTLDNKIVSGKQFVSYGEHSLYINNYSSFTDAALSNVKNEKDLEELLRENYTRFIIEGFPYSAQYIGKREYPGVSDNYGCIMKNTDPVYFTNKRSDFTIYTEIVVPNVGIFFKVNISESNSYWEYEHFSINALSSSTISDNKLYIKAVLSTNNPNISPKIDLVQVRVI